MRNLSYLFLVVLGFLSCEEKEKIELEHPFYQQVPVEFGMSLEDCRNVLPRLLAWQNDTLAYPHFAIEIDSTNSVFADDRLALVGMYKLGFDDGKLRKIMFHGADMMGAARQGKLSLRSSDEHFNKVINLTCEHFVNCDDFKIPRTLDEKKWENLSTGEYHIDFNLKGGMQFYYTVEVK